MPAQETLLTSTTASIDTPALATTDSLARERLSAGHVLLFIVSSATPITVVAGVVTTALAVTNILAVPLGFLAIGVLLALFVPGYLTMARTTPNPGAFYAYVCRGIGRPAGVAAGLVALLAYNALQVGLYGIWGHLTAALLGQVTGWNLPWWSLAAAAWLLVAILGVLRIDIAGWLLVGLLLAEIAIVVLVDLVLVPHPYQDTAQWAMLDPAHLTGGVGALLAMGLLGFVGIEQGAVFQSEARNRAHTVRRATWGGLLLLVSLYTGSSFLMGWAAGTGNLVDRASTEQTALFFNLASPYLGTAIVDIGNVLFCTSVLAALVSFHANCARYGFALGREGVLPRRFGAASRGQGSPAWASLGQSAVGAGAIATWALGGWDPLVTLFYGAGTFGGFGVAVLFALTAVAVVVHTARNRRRSRYLPRLVGAALAAAGLVAVVLAAVANYDVLVGVDPRSPWRIWLPGTVGIVAAIGVGWSLVLRRLRPVAYDQLGRGSDVSARPTDAR